MKTDRYGNPVTTWSSAALDHYDEALLLMRLYEGDPIAELDKAIEQDAGFTAAWAARAAILVQQSDRAYLPEAERSITAGLASGGNEQERARLAASADWAAGRIHRAVAQFAAISRDNPRDLLSLQTSHVGRFYLGQAQGLRDEPLRSLAAFGRADDGYHAVQGMAAFGLEECGDYDRALDLGGEAAAAEPRDAWAVHAVTHVHEMRGDTEGGIRWLGSNGTALSPRNAFSYHNWWHLALLHLDRDDHDAALALYDTHIRPDPQGDIVLEWVDASALLWRLHLDGVDTGDRFAQLAACWTRTMQDRLYAFNDFHALMAYLGAGQRGQAERCIEELRAAAMADDDNGQVARTVALPLAQAFMDYSEGRYAQACATLREIIPIAHRFGGSHAQRDILALTALHAARRGGLDEAAAALAAERLARKPHSPWARRLAAACSV